MHDIEAPYPDFPELATGHRHPVRVRDLNLDVVHGSTGGGGDGLKIVTGLTQRNHAGRFSEPVCGVDFLEAEYVFHVLNQLHGYGGCARDCTTQARGVECGTVWMV